MNKMGAEGMNMLIIIVMLVVMVVSILILNFIGAALSILWARHFQKKDDWADKE